MQRPKVSPSVVTPSGKQELPVGQAESSSHQGTQVGPWLTAPELQVSPSAQRASAQESPAAAVPGETGKQRKELRLGSTLAWRTHSVPSGHTAPGSRGSQVGVQIPI